MTAAPVDLNLRAAEKLIRRAWFDEHADAGLFRHFLMAAAERDLVGLWVWWANGPYREGRIARVLEDAKNGIVLEIEGKPWRTPLVDVLAAGWLQEDEHSDLDEWHATLAALKSRTAAR